VSSKTQEARVTEPVAVYVPEMEILTSGASPVNVEHSAIRKSAISPYDDWHRLAWAGALVLIFLIVISVSLVRNVTSRGVLKGAS